MTKPKYVSDCHNTPVVVGGRGLTHYYICVECGGACDVHCEPENVVKKTTIVVENTTEVK